MSPRIAFMPARNISRFLPAARLAAQANADARILMLAKPTTQG